MPTLGPLARCHLPCNTAEIAAGGLETSPSTPPSLRLPRAFTDGRGNLPSATNMAPLGLYLVIGELPCRQVWPLSVTKTATSLGCRVKQVLPAFSFFNLLFPFPCGSLLLLLYSSSDFLFCSFPSFLQGSIWGSCRYHLKNGAPRWPPPNGRPGGRSGVA